MLLRYISNLPLGVTNEGREAITRDAELWDSLGITEALWKKGESEEADIGEVYVPLTIEELAINFMTRLKGLSAQDMAEIAKMHKFQKRVEAEEDEDIKAQVLALLQNVTDTNHVTKSDVLVFKGKIRSAIQDLCRRHNEAIMAADSRKRKASTEALSPTQ